MISNLQGLTVPMSKFLCKADLILNAKSRYHNDFKLKDNTRSINSRYPCRVWTLRDIDDHLIESLVFQTMVINLLDSEYRSSDLRRKWIFWALKSRFKMYLCKRHIFIDKTITSYKISDKIITSCKISDNPALNWCLW